MAVLFNKLSLAQTGLILSEWTTIETICMVDKAVTNKRTRPLFLQLLSSEYCLCIGLGVKMSFKNSLAKKISPSELNMKYLEYLDARQIYTDCFSYKIENESQLLKFVSILHRKSLSRVRYLHLAVKNVVFSNQVWKDIATSLPTLLTLTLEGEANSAIHTESTLESSVQFPLVDSLVLTHCYLTFSPPLSPGDKVFNNLKTLTNIPCRSIKGYDIRSNADRASKASSLNALLAQIACNCQDSMEEFDLRGCDFVSDAAMATVADQCKQLTKLYLSDCKLLSSSTLIRLVTANPNLLHIELPTFAATQMFNSETIEAFLHAVANNCKSLRTFIANCWLDVVTTAMMETVVRSCVNLTNLSCQSRNIDIVSLTKAVLYHCPHIESLSISTQHGSKCEPSSAADNTSNNIPVRKALRSVSLTSSSTPNIDTALSLLARVAPNLSHLDLSESSQPHDKPFISLVNNCTALQSVNVANCGQLGNKSLKAISKHSKQLITLNLNFLPKVTASAVTNMITNCPALRKLELFEEENGCMREVQQFVAGNYPQLELIVKRDENDYYDDDGDYDFDPADGIDPEIYERYGEYGYGGYDDDDDDNY